MAHRPATLPTLHAPTPVVGRAFSRGWARTVSLCMALVLLAQLWVAGYQSVAAVTGMEICSAAGPVRVDADGRPIPAMSHDSHDCCLSLGAAALLPSPPVVLLAAVAHAAPSLALGAPRLSAETLTPLSRGPPLFS